MFFNWLGALGLVFAGATIYLVGLMPDIGKDTSEAGLTALGSAGTLTAAVFGLTVDRCERRGLWASYVANCSQFFRHAMGQAPLPEIGWNPYRRLAVVCFPLAAWPIAQWIGITIWFVVDILRGNVVTTNENWFKCIGVSTLNVLLAWIYAIASQKLRLIDDVGTTLLAPQTTTLVGRISQELIGDSNAIQPSRRPAVIVFVFSVFVMIIHHWKITTDGRGYMALALLPPMTLSMSLGTLLDPRVMWALKPEGKHYPFSVKAIAAFWLVLGITLGILMITVVYRF